LTQLGEAYDKPFLFAYVISYTFLVITLLSGYYLNVTQLLAYSSVYLAMITVSLTFMRGIENGKIAEGTALALASLFGISFVSSIVKQSWRIMGFYQMQPLASLAPNVPPEVALQVMMVIPNATAEEAFFRIGMYHMLKPLMPKHWAILTQATLFGVFHYYAYSVDIVGIVTAMAAGVALGIVYAITESEFAPTFAHIIYNLAAVLGA